MTSLLFVDPLDPLDPNSPEHAALTGEALYMLVADGEVKADEGNPAAIGWFARSAMALEDDEAWWVPLGRLGGRDRFAAVRIGTAAASEAKAFQPARQAGFLNLFQLARCARSEQQAAARAVHIGSWLHRSRYCGSCGGATTHVSALNKCVCQDGCGAEMYPRIEPAVLMLVVCGRACLLARQSSFPPRYLAPLAGFVEAGETPEQAVAREVAEEVGLRVDKSAYAAAQPWPVPASLMLGYIAEVAPGQQLRLSSELEAASWHERDELMGVMQKRDRDGPLILPPSGVIGRALIDIWVARGA